MTVRSVIFWPHLIAGVCAGAVIMLMSVTGVLLMYERQMIAWSDSHIRSVPPAPGAAPLAPEALLERVQAQLPAGASDEGEPPSALIIAADPGAPVSVSVGAQTLYVDAYTGTILGKPSQGVRRLMSGLRAWHRWLAVDGEGRTAARAITGWSNLLFLFIVVSGLYLWLPRVWRWQQVKPVLVFNGKLRGKARDFNWHNVTGVWCAAVLFIVVLGAVPISFGWANALLYRTVGEEPPAGGRGRGSAPAAASSRTAPTRGPSADAGGEEPEAASTFAGLNALWARAREHVPGWQRIDVRLPESPDGPVVFAIDRGTGGQPHLRSTLTLDRATGAVVSYEAFADQSLGRRLRSILRFAHTGEVLGLPGQTVAGVASAGGAVLVWTGMALAWRRFRAWRRRLAARAVPHAPPIGRESAAAAASHFNYGDKS